jgi:hypothetical protein
MTLRKEEISKKSQSLVERKQYPAEKRFTPVVLNSGNFVFLSQIWRDFWLSKLAVEGRKLTTSTGYNH